MTERLTREMIMPVSDEGAALQFFIEAMKQNTAALQQVGQTMKGIQQEQKETLQIVHDTRERVIKLETTSHAGTIAELKMEVAALQQEIQELKLERAGRTANQGLLKWLFPNGQSLIFALGFLILALIVLKSSGKM